MVVQVTIAAKRGLFNTVEYMEVTRMTLVQWQLNSLSKMNIELIQNEDTR